MILLMLLGCQRSQPNRNVDQASVATKPTEITSSWTLTTANGDVIRSGVVQIPWTSSLTNRQTLMASITNSLPVKASGWYVWETSFGPEKGFMRQLSGQFQDGKEVGLWITWGMTNYDGIVGRFKISEETFDDGVRNGTNRWWFQDILVREEIWQHGKPAGIWRYWNHPSRQLIYERDVKSERVKIWNRDGSLVADGVYRGGKPWEGSFLSPWAYLITTT